MTGTHPVCSVDRNDWVSVADLEIDEEVKTLNNTTTVESIEKTDRVETVYNIEVEGEHVYRVGESGLLVHNTSANIVEDSNNNSTNYYAHDCTDSELYIDGKLRGGVLGFVIKAGQKFGGTVSGKEFFNAMMNHFGKGNVSIIEGDWSDDEELGDNLVTYNKERKAGVAPEVAASRTWTGQRATDWGYTKIEVIRELPEEPAGEHTLVLAYFKLPTSS